MNADHAVLGCVLLDNRVHRSAAEIITGADFADPRLGAVFDGLGRVIASGQAVNEVSVTAYFSEWGVRGVEPADPFRWKDAAGFYPQIIADHARVVRDASLRRTGTEILAPALTELADTGSDPAVVLENVTRALSESKRPGTELHAVPLGDILKIDEQYDWVIPHLLERQDRLILTGHEGLGKSTFARQLMLMAGGGLNPFPKYQPYELIDPVRSLVIDAENTAKQWRRNAHWLRNRVLEHGSADPAETVTIATSGRVNVLDPRVLGNIHRLIGANSPDLVFIGPLYRITPGAITTDTDAAEVITALDTIRDRGVALVMEAHAGHALGVGGQRDVRPRGSSALMGWPEFGLGIRSDLDNPARYELVPWRGSREERDWPNALRKGQTWPWEGIWEL